MLHIKYQGSRPYGFRQEDFFMVFPLLTYAKYVIPGAEPWHNLNKLGRGLLGDATYQNIKALGLMVSDKKIYHVFPI